MCFTESSFPEIKMAKTTTAATTRASERNFTRGYEDRYRAHLASAALVIGVARGVKGAMPPNIFRKYSHFVL